MSEARANATENNSAEILVEHLRLFENFVTINIFHTCFKKALCRNEGNEAKGSIARLARLDAWIATVVTYPTERKTHGDKGQTMYSIKYAFYVTAAIRQIVGRVGPFLKAWEPGAKYVAPAQFTSDSVAQKNKHY